MNRANLSAVRLIMELYEEDLYLEEVERENCQHCRGERYVGCPRCQGRGVISPRTPIAQVQGILYSCGKCEGRGIIECPVCGGTGW